MVSLRHLIAVLSLIWVSANGVSAGELTFRLRPIAANAEHHSVAVFDVNGDGELDLVSGSWWYEGPQWQPHFVRDVTRIRGRFDDYSHLPLDVNGDGFLDLISANYRSQSIYWVEHPGEILVADAAANAPWQTHEIDRPGPMETGRLADVDGDGRLDILPNGIRFAAWWSLEQDDSGDPMWTRHDLPEEIAGHGIGIGDINGDGRDDLVSPRGWLEAPEDRRGGRWIYHPDFQLDRDGSIPILVWDVDQDGDQDIVWGRGHHIGLYWLEQLVHEESTSWVRHAIDTSWSQPHSILAADVDKDGETELVAGKRYLGHDGKDPGELDPLVAYWYDFDPDRRIWERGEISGRGPAGFGLDPKAADVDQDGDLDLVVADRSGLYLLENELVGGPYAEPSQLLVFRNDDGEAQVVSTPAEMALRRADILQAMQRVMGTLPESRRRVPLDYSVQEELDRGRYLRQRIRFTAEPGDEVPAYLLIPKGLTERAPAMLCLHQTTAIGKGEPAGLGGKPSLHYAHELAERGFVCMVPDYPSFGDYDYDFALHGRHYESGSMKAIWNNVRAIDLLQSLPHVDRDRIGCIGHSLGGHNALFTAAFDQRIRAVVTSCGFTAFHDYYEGNLRGWTSDRYMPRIRDVYENDPDRMPFDFYGVLAAIAPRPIFVNAPLRDGNFAVDGVRRVETAVRPVYELLGADKSARFEYPDSAHDFPAETRHAAYDWLQANLK